MVELDFHALDLAIENIVLKAEIERLKYAKPRIKKEVKIEITPVSSSLLDGQNMQGLRALSSAEIRQQQISMLDFNRYQNINSGAWHYGQSNFYKELFGCAF